MARASTITKLPLDRFAFWLGANPRHFNQVTLASDPQEVCDHPMKQFAWQASDAISREDIAQAIQAAEAAIEQHTGYHLLPTFTADERLNTVIAAGRAFNYAGVSSRWQPKSVELPRGYLISGGIRARTLLDDAVAIVWSAGVGDPSDYDGLGTVTVIVPTGTLACEIHLYYPGLAASDEWEIRPITASVTGVTATITFRRELAVDPDLLEAFYPEGVDGTVDANFLSTVDVYRVWLDPQTQVTLEWTPGYGGIGIGYCCGASSCVACQVSAQTGCIGVRDHRLGYATYIPSTWDADTDTFLSAYYSACREPDRLRLWYYSGWQDQSRVCSLTQMDPYWERAVTYLAAAYLDRDMCGCEALKSYSAKWRANIALNVEGQNFQTTQRQLENPFGTTVGAQYAWQAVTRPGKQIGGKS